VQLGSDSPLLASLPSRVVAAVPTAASAGLGDRNLFHVSDWVAKEDARTQSPLFIAYAIAAGASHAALCACVVVDARVGTRR
jgi:hypothetical protein